MSIKATCGNCDSSFKAKDSLAGKRVKCPKCKKPMEVPSPPVVAATGASALGAYDPIAELLDEANVKGVVRGAGCPDCGAEVRAGAIICVDCGFNIETGEKLKTRTGGGVDSEIEDVGMTDADKIMRKAEEEIDETPIVSDGEDFGDGGDSFVIAGVAGGILLVIVAIALLIIMTMEQVSKVYNSAFISCLASGGLWAAMTLWIGYVAMRAKPIHGIACVATAGLYAIFFGFMQGKSLIVPTICLIISMFIGLASFAYVSYNGIAPVESRIDGPVPHFQMADSDLPSIYRERLTS